MIRAILVLSIACPLIALGLCTLWVGDLLQRLEQE